MSLNILLISKDWLEWADESKSLTAGARLIFRPRSEVTYKEKVSHHSVAVAGDVLVRDHLGCLVKVYVDFERNESQGNPVVDYPQRLGLEKSAPIPLTAEYNLTSDLNLSLYHAPSDRCGPRKRFVYVFAALGDVAWCIYRTT